jgi:hypothetical protein
LGRIEAGLGDTLKKEHGDGAKKMARKIHNLLSNAVDHTTIDIALEEINTILKGFGVESMRDKQHRPYYQDIGLLYVNMGDTYATTICFDTRKRRFFVCSMGDFIEHEPKRFK